MQQLLPLKPLTELLDIIYPDQLKLDPLKAILRINEECLSGRSSGYTTTEVLRLNRMFGILNLPSYGSHWALNITDDQVEVYNPNTQTTTLAVQADAIVSGISAFGIKPYLSYGSYLCKHIFIDEHESIQETVPGSCMTNIGYFSNFLYGLTVRGPGLYFTDEPRLIQPSKYYQWSSSYFSSPMNTYAVLTEKSIIKMIYADVESKYSEYDDYIYRPENQDPVVLDAVYIDGATRFDLPEEALKELNFIAFEYVIQQIKIIDKYDMLSLSINHQRELISPVIPRVSLLKHKFIKEPLECGPYTPIKRKFNRLKVISSTALNVFEQAVSNWLEKYELYSDELTSSLHLINLDTSTIDLMKYYQLESKIYR